MTKQKDTDSPVTYGDIGRIYREKLSKVSDQNYKHIRVLNEHFISPDGHVRRSANVLTEALEDGVDKFYWRVPIVRGNSRVTGLRVSPSKDIENYVLREEKDFRVIEISICPLKKGERAHIQFEYYVTNVCEIAKNGVFFRELRYPFAYKPTSTTESFEFRLYLPLSAKLEIVSNLPTPEVFRAGTDQLIIASEEEFSTGDIVGNAQVKFKTGAYMPLVSLGLGTLSTMLIALIKYGDKFIGAWHLILIPLVLSMLFFAALKLFRVE